MRKHVFSGMLLAVVVGLSLPPGLGKVKAEDGTGVFPPDMLKIPVLTPALEDSLLKAAPTGDAVTQAAAPAQPAGLAESSALAAPSTLLASTDSAKTRAKTSVLSKVSEPDAPAAKHQTKARLAHRAHSGKRHVLHARRLPLPPIKVVAAPRPAVQIVQTAAASCAGFCGKYVLVGVGF
jgi:hypothetical protein